nr:zinc finger, CCHC-type [Tanacetum cinerariifolium]
KFDETGKGVVICLYVDNILIFGTNQVQVNLTKKSLSSRFSMKDIREADVILVSTPMDCEKLMPNNGHDVSQLKYYRVIGFLMYDMTCIRLDIAFVVGKLSMYTSNPGTQHWQAIQRVLKYLKKTMDYRLTYIGYPSVLEGYTDASWISNTKDNSSTSGWVFLLGGGAISWTSKKQTCITGSTIESEFMALVATGRIVRNLVQRGFSSYQLRDWRFCIPYPFHQFIIMSNINNNMQTQTSNTLHNAIMEAGSKDRPPMLAPGIDNDIYSTVDACPNACEMWKVIERLKQGELINVQDLETNLFWEFRKSTSLDGESLESYYSRFYKMMNELTRNQCNVTNHQVNVQFLLQLQPEWQRFVTLVKQSQELKNVSYLKLYDILKQHQHEVNEIRAEKIARIAN